MKGFKLYLDEDASSFELLRALRLRDVDVTTVVEEKRRRKSDVDQLIWALHAGRVIYTFNARDFCRLHKEIILAGKEHAGLLVGHQQQFSIGEQLRRLLSVLTARSQDEMRNEIEFLSNWGQ